MKKNDNNPKVSIIVPVYNVEKYLKKCLDSLINQTLKEIEIIIVNDGSPDNSQKIIDDYKEKYPQKIASFIKENGGQGEARNYGLKKSHGEFIGYVDSDDYVELDMYEKLYNKAIQNNSDIVICGSYNILENGHKTIDLEESYVNDIQINALLGKKAVWNKIYRRELLLENNLSFRCKLWYEDFDFTIKTLSKTKNISYVNEPLYNYLIRNGSTMNNSNIDRNLEILEAFNEIINLNKQDEYKEIITFLAIDHIYISTTVRILNANADKTKKKENINIILNYMHNNFHNFKNNKYLYILPKNRKIIYKLLNYKLYLIVYLIFKIKRRK